MLTRPGLRPTGAGAGQRTGQRRFIVGAGLAAALALTGCGQAAAPQAHSVGAGSLPGEHIHGISRDPGSGKVNLATHEGLFVRQPDGSWLQVGPTVDLMSFAITGPGSFYASGHPADGVDLPAPVGLIKSTDAGRTWTVQSRGGESDFHALAASTAGVMGFDGVLRTSADGKSWVDGGLKAEPRSLASSPDGSQVLATTEQGVLRSADGGRTWLPLASAPPLTLAAWADATTVVGVSTQGSLVVSADAGRTWRTNLAALPDGQAISAGRAKNGRLEILAVTETGVLQSHDDGATLTKLTS